MRLRDQYGVGLVVFAKLDDVKSLENLPDLSKDEPMRECAKLLEEYEQVFSPPTVANFEPVKLQVRKNSVRK